MNWFLRMFVRYGTAPPHIRGMQTQEEMSRRLAALSAQEETAYKWLLEGYSEAWTTETMGLDRRRARRLYAGIYRKLGVVSSREIIRYYAVFEVRNRKDSKSVDKAISAE